MAGPSTSRAPRGWPPRRAHVVVLPLVPVTPTTRELARGMTEEGVGDRAERPADRADHDLGDVEVERAFAQERDGARRDRRGGEVVAVGLGARDAGEERPRAHLARVEGDRRDLDRAGSPSRRLQEPECCEAGFGRPERRAAWGPQVRLGRVVGRRGRSAGATRLWTVRRCRRSSLTAGARSSSGCSWRISAGRGRSDDRGRGDGRRWPVRRRPRKRRARHLAGPGGRRRGGQRHARAPGAAWAAAGSSSSWRASRAMVAKVGADAAAP